MLPDKRLCHYTKHPLHCQYLFKKFFHSAKARSSSGENRYTLSLDAVTREAIKATRELFNLMKNVDDLKREYQLNIRTLELADKQVMQLEKQQSAQKE